MTNFRKYNLFDLEPSPDFKTIKKEVNQDLKWKYKEYFNFYYSKEIDLIVDNFRSKASIDFKDNQYNQENKERLKRFYNQEETKIRLKNYTAYYAKLDDYQVPSFQIHTHQKIMFRRQKLNYRLKKRNQDQRKTKQIGRHNLNLLQNLADETVYLQKVAEEKNLKVKQKFDSLQENYAQGIMNQLDYDEVHDIYDPKFSESETSINNDSINIGGVTLLEGDDFGDFKMQKLEKSSDSLATEFSDIYMLEESNIEPLLKKKPETNVSYSILKIAENLQFGKKQEKQKIVKKNSRQLELKPYYKTVSLQNFKKIHPKTSKHNRMNSQRNSNLIETKRSQLTSKRIHKIEQNEEKVRKRRQRKTQKSETHNSLQNQVIKVKVIKGQKISSNNLELPKEVLKKNHQKATSVRIDSNLRKHEFIKKLNLCKVSTNQSTDNQTKFSLNSKGQMHNNLNQVTAKVTQIPLVSKKGKNKFKRMSQEKQIKRSQSNFNTLDNRDKSKRQNKEGLQQINELNLQTKTLDNNRQLSTYFKSQKF